MQKIYLYICPAHGKSCQKLSQMRPGRFLVNSRGPTTKKYEPVRPEDLGTKDLGARILVPGSWYQDLGTKIYGEPERRSLSVCRGARGAAGPPPGGLGGWKPPRKSGGSGGRQPPSKNNFMDPESKIDASCGSGAHPYQNPLYEQKVGPHMYSAVGR